MDCRRIRPQEHKLRAWASVTMLRCFCSNPALCVGDRVCRRKITLGCIVMHQIATTPAVSTCPHCVSSRIAHGWKTKRMPELPASWFPSQGCRMYWMFGVTLCPRLHMHCRSLQCRRYARKTVWSQLYNQATSVLCANISVITVRRMQLSATRKF